MSIAIDTAVNNRDDFQELERERSSKSELEKIHLEKSVTAQGSAPKYSNYAENGINSF